jgi:hypothetical protein
LAVLVALTTIGRCQDFTLTSHFQYFFEYPKNESFDSLFWNEKLMAYGISEKEISYRFNLVDSIMTMQFFRDSLVIDHFIIVEYSSFLDSNIVIKCVILDSDGLLYDVVSTIDLETNIVDLVYVSSYTDKLNRGGYHPRMSYEFH